MAGTALQPVAPAQQATPSAVEQTLGIRGMSCAACQIHVQRALEAVPGVQSVSVDLLGHKALITGNAALPPERLAEAVRSAGYDVAAPGSTIPEKSGSPTGFSPVASSEDSSLGFRAAFSLVAGGIAMVLSMPLMAGDRAAITDPLSHWLLRLSGPLMPAALMAVRPEVLRWVLAALAMGAMIFAAPEVYGAAWRAARHRATNMNTLVALGTLSAFAVSLLVTVADALRRPLPMFGDVYYEAVVLILGFLLAGRWLEGRARRRALRDVGSFARVDTAPARWLAESAPENPEGLLGAPETLLPVDALVVGDILRVLPGDRLPLDALILAGRGSVDESMLTGEPLPVTRVPGDRLLGGTLNLDGALILRATALGTDSTLAQMSRLLERARSTRAPMQRLADRASAIFVPCVLLLAALTFLLWALADNTGIHHRGFGRPISLAISVLVIACPCAMGLAVPAAIAVALGSGARAGVLFKDGEAVERLAACQVIAFDKTGTLTEGKPQIRLFQQAAFLHGESNLLRWAYAVEQLSTHPLAAAVCTFAASQGVELPTQAVSAGRVLPGTGCEATVEGHLVVLGNAAVLPENTPIPSPPPGCEHATPMYLLVDGRHQGTFYALDTPRPSTHGMASALRDLGLRSVLLTGDTAEAAWPVASELGIADVRAKLLPGQKVLAIEALQQEGKCRVAMAGDGLNDAAALAQADAGIAVASGTDLARDAGHLLLLHHDLGLVPFAIRLARRTRGVMRQNLLWAMVYNLIGIPLAAGLLLPHFGIALSPALASAAMALSSVSVLLNSLRLAGKQGTRQEAQRTR